MKSEKLKVKNSKLRNESGFGLVEIIVVVVIVTVSFLSIMAFFLFSRASTFKAQRNAEATSLTEQAIEAVRKLRDESWTSNIATLSNSSTYFLKLQNNNRWVLQTTNPNPSSFYTTSVVLSAVNRDASSNIADVGTNDPNTRKLVATTSWNNSGSNSSVVLTTYITNFNNN